MADTASGSFTSGDQRWSPASTPATRLADRVEQTRSYNGYDLDAVLYRVDFPDDKSRRTRVILINEQSRGLIVNALRAHDDMLSALKAAESAIEDCHHFRKHHHFDELKLVRAAIAKAEGK